MLPAYLTITFVAAVANGSAAIANLIGHDYPKSQADRLGLSCSWIRPLGTLLALGTLGLIAGIAVPVLGTVAAVGLVLYFLSALFAHLRVGDRQLTAWAVYFCLSMAALAVNVAYHDTW
ncbi:DoxX family protein [Streptomyces sp. PmtG]